jgi:hypothetical protein
MSEFEVNTVINKPVNIIVDALTNPDNFVHWQTDLVKFEVIERKPGEVGSIAHLHYSQKGRSYIMEDKMIYCEPGKKYVSEVSGDVITAKIETTLQPMGKKTKIKIKWSGKGKIFLLKLLLPLMKTKMIKQSKKELDIFKQLIETKGSDFSSQ